MRPDYSKRIGQIWKKFENVRKSQKIFNGVIYFREVIKVFKESIFIILTITVRLAWLFML